MRKVVNGLVVAFLIVFFNSMTPVVSGLILAKGSATLPFRVLDVDVFRRINEGSDAKQIDINNGKVREVTAYIVGDTKQTDSKPCIGATGDNLCNLVEKGVNVCAANFVPLKSKLYIEKVGECVVLDRMNARFGNRVDLAMGKRQHDRAVKFGVQRLSVIKGWD
jgi:3D (Asp-Asp-Asp) domain-containing protein